jgi:hypothetical protein
MAISWQNFENILELPVTVKTINFSKKRKALIFNRVNDLNIKQELTSLFKSSV